MPTLLSESVVSIEFADLARRRPIDRPTRSLLRHKGWHQSGVLAYIAREVGWLKPGEPLEDELPGRLALGIMWEEFYFSLEPSTTIWQPGEVVKDRIAMNADGIGPWKGAGRNERAVMVETKCTEKKVREGEEFLQEKMWMYQGMNYLSGYGPIGYDGDELSSIVRYVVNFYRGDYRGSGPIVKEYAVEFGEEEVKSAWRLMLKYRDRTEKEG
jgi:hypothetical protein